MSMNRAWAVAAVAALSVMAALGFGRFSYTMLLTSTRDGLHLTYTDVGFLGTANFAGYLLGSWASGRIIRWLGPHLAGCLALLGVALSLAWMGIARGVLDASLARACCGALSAIAYVQTLGVVVAWFPPDKRGLASGLAHSGNGCGFILAGLALPWIIDAMQPGGWRAAWEFLAVATLLVFPFAWTYLRYPNPDDFIRASDLSSPVAKSSRGAMIKFGVLYSLFGLSYVIYITFFVDIVQHSGLSLARAGIIWALVGALSLASGALAGALSDRIGRTSGLALLFGLQSVAYGLMLLGAAWSIVASAVVFGATAWGFPSIMAAIASDHNRSEDVMPAFGRMTAIMGIGQAVGPVAAGALADASGVVDSGLYIAIAAAASGLIWSLFIGVKDAQAAEGG